MMHRSYAFFLVDGAVFLEGASSDKLESPASSGSLCSSISFAIRTIPHTLSTVLYIAKPITIREKLVTGLTGFQPRQSI